MDSILSSVKQMLGIPADDTFFDQTLILHINTIFSVLSQLGCGPLAGYAITGPENTWDEFLLYGDPEKLRHVKTYMGLRVRQLFDPPTNGTVANALERQIAELEWRISVQVDPGAIEAIDGENVYGRFDDLDDNEF